MTARGKLLVLIFFSFFLSGCSILNRKNIAGLQVITNDVSSSLFLDGQYLDKTPYINKNIQPGDYTLKIQPDDQNLVPYETQIFLRKSTLTVVTWKPGDRAETSGGIIYEMEKIKNNQGELSFITIPNNAIIRFDQGEQQFSPLVITDIQPGHHQFEIGLPSYEEQQHTINVIKGYRINITAKLAKSKPQSSDDTTVTKTKKETTTDTVVKDKLAQSQLESTQSASISAKSVTIKPTGFFQNQVEVLKVRAAASATAEIVGYAKSGQSYPYLDTSNQDWYQIKLDKIQGWVSGKYVSLSNNLK